jgi:hypothetical protein
MSAELVHVFTSALEIAQGNAPDATTLPPTPAVPEPSAAEPAAEGGSTLLPANTFPPVAGSCVEAPVPAASNCALVPEVDNCDRPAEPAPSAPQPTLMTNHPAQIRKTAVFRLWLPLITKTSVAIGIGSAPRNVRLATLRLVQSVRSLLQSEGFGPQARSLKLPEA